MTEFEVAFSFGGLVMIEKSTMATLLGLTLSTFAVCSALPNFQRSTSNCPTPNNCNNDYNPGDCQRIEQGVFEVNGRECPGCKICIREADKYYRLIQWLLRKPDTDAEYLDPSCWPLEAEFSCRETRYNGMAIWPEGFLYHNLEDGCLIDVYPGTAPRNDPSECQTLQLHDQYFYEGNKKCYIYDAIHC